MLISFLLDLEADTNATPSPSLSNTVPSIAQLVERWTVVGTKQEQTSIGRWFESGSKEETFLTVRHFFGARVVKNPGSLFFFFPFPHLF